MTQSNPVVLSRETVKALLGVARWWANYARRPELLNSLQRDLDAASQTAGSDEGEDTADKADGLDTRRARSAKLESGTDHLLWMQMAEQWRAVNPSATVPSSKRHKLP